MHHAPFDNNYLSCAQVSHSSSNLSCYLVVDLDDFQHNCEPWIEFNNLLSYSSITFFGNNDLNPYKPPSNNY
jgi:hypothetical protein